MGIHAYSPDVRIKSDGTITNSSVEVKVDDEWVDISQLVAGIEWNISGKSGIASAWLKVLLPSVEVEAELRKIAGERLYVEEKA